MITGIFFKSLWVITNGDVKHKLYMQFMNCLNVTTILCAQWEITLIVFFVCVKFKNNVIILLLSINDLP